MDLSSPLLIWTDYRLSVVFIVLIPLVLSLWAFVKKADPILRLLTIYWRVSSLLLVTLYLMIAAFPLSFLSSVIARFLLPISLWFWVDLNEEIEDRPPSPLKLIFSAWRWSITVYSTLGGLFQLFFLKCAFESKEELLSNSFCRIWLDPAWLYKGIFHANTKPSVLGFLGLVGLVFYGFYFLSFVFVKLGKQGRITSGN